MDTAESSFILAHHHTFQWGPTHALGVYLEKNSRRFYFYQFPFGPRRRMKPLPETLELGINFLTLCTKGALHKTDCFIGADPLNALAGLWLRFLGRTRKVVFYSIDYSPRRFSNPILNRLYFWSLRKAVRSSDAVWTMSERMSAALGRGVVVPTGYSDEELPGHMTKTTDFIVAGSIRKDTGEGIIPDSVQTVRGVPDHREMLRRVSAGRVGLAIYAPGGIAEYGDPGRVKEYLALGMPVIMTDVPEFSKTIIEEKAGLVIKYDREELKEAMDYFRFIPDFTFEEIAFYARRLSRRFEYSKVFGEALSRL